MLTSRGRYDGRSWALAFAVTLLLAGVFGFGTRALAQQAAGIDPPGRVARLAEVDGDVWLYSPDTNEWLTAVRNRPLTSGDRLATDPGARAELQVGSTTLRLDASSELELLQLDDDQFVMRLHAGAIAVQVRDLALAGDVEVETDEGRFIVERSGRYRFDQRDGSSDVTAYSGRVRYEGPDSALAIVAGERATFAVDSSGTAQYSLSAPLNDAFSAWSADTDRRAAGGVSGRYVSPEIAGVAELDRYGRWEHSSDYGPIWIPTAVASGWSPYSQGHWAWVRPWGWTWVDDAPWGFAPFHYGRWVYLRNNWCWTPGERVVRPVYAPALVGWIGGRRGDASIVIGGVPSVGWFPLAPREVYVPSYPVSPRYARSINITVGSVAQITQVLDQPHLPRNFENRRHPRAVTFVPASVIAERRPVAPAAEQLRRAEPRLHEWTNRPERTTALLAPPVGAPLSSPARGNEPRGIGRPPVGTAPSAGDRPTSVFPGHTPGHTPGRTPDRAADRRDAFAEERDARRTAAPELRSLPPVPRGAVGVPQMEPIRPMAQTPTAPQTAAKPTAPPAGDEAPDRRLERGARAPGQDPAQSDRGARALASPAPPPAAEPAPQSQSKMRVQPVDRGGDRPGLPRAEARERSHPIQPAQPPQRLAAPVGAERPAPSLSAAPQPRKPPADARRADAPAREAPARRGGREAGERQR